MQRCPENSWESSHCPTCWQHMATNGNMSSCWMIEPLPESFVRATLTTLDLPEAAAESFRNLSLCLEGFSHSHMSWQSSEIHLRFKTKKKQSAKKPLKLFFRSDSLMHLFAHCNLFLLTITSPCHTLPSSSQALQCSPSTLLKYLECISFILFWILLSFFVCLFVAVFESAFNLISISHANWHANWPL